MSLFTPEQISQELTSFIDWPTDNRNFITSTSAALFAAHIQKKATEHLLTELEQHKRDAERLREALLDIAEESTDHSAVLCARAALNQQQPNHIEDTLEMVKPVIVEAAAVTRKNSDVELYLDWLREGDITALKNSGVTLVVAHDSITNDAGYGEVYPAQQQAKVKP